MRNKWFSIIGRTVSYKGARVCSDHFTENDFHEMSLYSRIRRLKSTAIPSVYIKQNRKDKKKKSSILQETNMNVSEIESQNDSEIESQNEKDAIYDNTKNCEENNTRNDVKSTESENVEQKSTPVLNITENLVNASLDSERKINTISINNTSENNKKNVDNIVNNNSISGKRKLSSSNLGNSKIRKIFVHMSKYNIECFRKMDFSSDKKWSAFLRYVAYNRHQNKILAQKNRRLEKKMYILQDMLEELM
ncbi:probable basic-leucine zipper transcription factor S isoform X2 [Cataglyphis hispanica]|nr:probable basic-leucine zipper transcription factor S isoform X2 [Cataglyphis hispanica]